jgi:AraC family transcriptional regulator
MNNAVERAIKFICERYSEPLSLDDIANSAIMSRFHFCRTFANATGVTPGRFLSAIRIYEAKRKLLNTEMNVTDITFAVGFNSLGSFSNHFTDSVGVSPGRFRRISRNGGFELKRFHERSSRADSPVAGTVALPKGCADARVFLGIFDTPIVQRQPAASVTIEAVAGKPCRFQLPGVPDGDYFLRAVAVADTSDPEPWTRRVLLVGGCELNVAGAPLLVRVEMRPKRATDLPILLALPELEPLHEDLSPLRPSLAGSRA